MGILVIAFVVSFVAIPLLYKYVTPVLSGGKVVLKDTAIWRYAVFGISMCIAFVPIFLASAVGIAVAITPYVSSYVNSAAENVMFLISSVFRLILSQLVIFVLTLAAGRIFKKTLTVDGKFAAWKAAWAPAIYFLLLSLAIGYVLMSTLQPLDLPSNSR